MPTSAKNWQTTVTLKLPSGNVARLRRVALIDLIVKGDIPQTLTAAAVEIAGQTGAKKLTEPELKNYESIVNTVVMAAMVEPKASTRAGDDTVAIDDIDFVDRVQIFNWANGGVHSLRPFRGDTQGQTRTFDAS